MDSQENKLGPDLLTTISSDVFRLLALNMTIASINAMSRTSRRFNNMFCNYGTNNENFEQVSRFWRDKTQKDFGKESIQSKMQTLEWRDYYFLILDHPEVGKCLSGAGFSTSQLFFLCRLFNGCQINGQQATSKQNSMKIFELYYNFIDLYRRAYMKDNPTWNRISIEFLNSEDGYGGDRGLISAEGDFVKLMAKAGLMFRRHLNGKQIHHVPAANRANETIARFRALRLQVIEYLNPIIANLKKGLLTRTNNTWEGNRDHIFLTNDESKINRRLIKLIITSEGSESMVFDAGRISKIKPGNLQALKTLIIFKFSKTLQDVEPPSGSGYP